MKKLKAILEKVLNKVLNKFDIKTRWQLLDEIEELEFEIEQLKDEIEEKENEYEQLHDLHYYGPDEPCIYDL